MTVALIVLAVTMALIAQTVLARLMVGVVEVDALLVIVVFVALSRGRMFGFWTGVVVGFVQDLLSGGIVGVSGLSKGLTGFWVGWLDSHLIATATWPRAAILVVASVFHGVVVFCVYRLMLPTEPGFYWRDVALHAGANVFLGFMLMVLAERWPSLVKIARGRDSGRIGRRWGMS